MGIVMSPTGRKRQLWRFGDAPNDDVDLDDAQLFEPN
jgi:hypothetical protein